MDVDIQQERELREMAIIGLRSIIDERDRRYEGRFVAMDEKTTLALTASDKAVSKAEIAAEKRFENTNEWRAAMQDRDRQQMPRVEIEQRFDSLINGLRWAAGIGITLVLAAVTVVTHFWH